MKTKLIFHGSLWLLLCFCGFINPTKAQVSLVAGNEWSKLYTTPTNSAAASLTNTVSYTINSGSNRLLVVAISAGANVNGALVNPAPSVTWGGKTLTASSVNPTSANRAFSFIFYLKESDIAAGANTNLVVSMGGTTFYGYVTYAAVYKDVDQATPVRNAVASANSGTASNTATVNANFTAGDQGIFVTGFSLNSAQTGSYSSVATNWTGSSTLFGGSNSTTTAGSYYGGIGIRSITSAATNEAVSMTITSGGTLRPSINVISLVPVPMTFRSVATGAWNSSSTWEQSGDGISWSAASTTPGSTNPVIIQAGHTVTLGSASTSKSLTVKGGGTLALSTFGFSTDSISTDCGASSAATISGSGTLTLSGNGNITVANAGAGTAGAVISCPVALGATRTFTVANDGTSATDLTISGVISGAAFGITKAGAGTLYLSAANTYTGAVTISAGTLLTNTVANASSNSSLGTGAGTPAITIAAGATLAYNGSGHSSSRAITLSGTGAIIDASGSGALTLSGAVSGATFGLVLTGSGAGTMSGIIGTTSGTLTKNGSGTWTLSAANTYTGATNINAGILKLGVGSTVGTSGPLGTNAGGVTVASGAALDLNGFSNTGGTAISAEALTINGTGISSGGALMNSGAAATYFGLVTLGSNSSVIGESGSITLSNTGTITGAGYSLTLGGSQGGSVSTSINTGSLIKEGSGTWTLSGASSYSGSTTINGGTLKAGVATSAFGSGSAVSLANTAGVSLDITGFNNTIGSLTGGGANGGNVTLGAATLTIGSDNTSPAAYNGVISGTGGITKSGTGTLTLSAANNYSGATAINAGAIRITNDAGLGTTAGSTTIASGGSLEISGGITSAEAFSIAGTGVSNAGALRNISGNNTLSGAISTTAAAEIASDAGILTLSNANSITGAADNLTLDGEGDGIISGIIATTTGTLTKSGNGTWTLSGANTYSGLTTISAGILKLNNAAALGGVTNGTTISSGAALDLNGINYSTAEPLTISGTGVSSGGAIMNSSITGATFSGLVTLGSDASIAGESGTINISNAGTITGSGFVLTLSGSQGGTLTSPIGTATGGLTKAGSGTWTVSGASQYIGTTLVSNGTLKLGASGRIHNASTLNISSGATFDLAGFSDTVDIITGTGNIDNTSGAGTYTIGAGGNGGNFSFEGLITNTSGSVRFEKVGNGTGSLTNTSNSFSGGIIISGGTLSLSSPDGLPSASEVILNGGTLNTAGYAKTFNSLSLPSLSTISLGAGTHDLTFSSVGTISPSGLLSITGWSGDFVSRNIVSPGRIFVGSSQVLTSGQLSQIKFYDGSSYYPSQQLSTGELIPDTGAIVFTSVVTGNWTNPATWGYSGTASAGLNYPGSASDVTVSATHTVTLTSATSTTGNLTVNGTLALAGYNMTAGSLSGSATAISTASGTPTLTVGSKNTSTTFSGIISGATAFTKTGTGTITLSGANTFTGTTTVSQGAIKLGAAERISNSSALSISSGASFDMGGFSETVGSLAGDGTLDNTVAGTVTFTAGGNNSSTTFSGIIQNTAGTLSFTKAGTGTLTLSGNNTHSGTTTVNAGGTLKLGTTSALGNTTGGTSVANGGVLDLNGQNYSSEEALTLAGDGLSAGYGALINSSASAASFNGLISIGTAAAYIITNAGGISITNPGTITGTVNFYFGGSGNGSIASIVGIGNNTVNKTGTGTWTLSGANTYTALTNINGGTLIVGNASALGTTSAATVIDAGAYLDLNGFSISSEALTSFNGNLINSSASAVTFSGNITGAASGGKITVDNGDITLSGIVSSAGNSLTINGSGNGFITGNTDGTSAGAFVKSGTGTWTLSGNNAHNGATNITAGILKINSSNALGTVTGATTVSSGAVLDLNGINYSTAEALTINGTGISGGGAVINSSASAATFGGLITMGSSSSIVGGSGTINISNTGTITGAGFNLTLGGAQGGSIASIIGTTTGQLIKEGTGTWTVSGANTYTGATAINAGILRINNAAALGTAAAGTTVANGAALDLNGISYTTNAEALTISGTGVSTGGAIMNSSATAANFGGLITLNASSSIMGGTGSVTISNAGAITGAGFSLTLGGAAGGTLTSILGMGTGALIKEGSGTWVLGGANTYTGNTIVNAGVLQLGAANRISNSSALILGGGTFSTGPSGSAGFTDTLSSITVNASSNISLGTGSHNLVFAASNGIAWTGGSTLTVSGWTGTYNGSSSGTAGRLFMGSTSSGVTATQLAQIKFFDGLNNTDVKILATGEIVGFYSDLSNLSYTTPNIFTAGTAIASLSPTVTGAVTLYRVSPSLPAGLSINSTTGVISGTPTTTTAAADYTVTASNGVDSLTFAINITINPGAPSKFVISNISNQTAGASFNVVVSTQDANGNSSNVSSDIGFSLDIATGSSTLQGTLNGTIASGTNTVTLTGISYTVAESISISATQTSGSPAITSATSNTFSVGVGALSTFALEDSAGGGVISNQTVAVSFKIRITAQDAYGNTVTSFSGAGKTVNITSTGTLSAGSGTTATFTNGVLVFHTVTISNSGTFTITATQSGASVTGISNSFIVGQNRYAVVASGNWNATTTWSATSGGAAGASIPAAGDNVFIGEGGVARAITIPSGYSAVAGNLYFNSNSFNVVSSLTFASATSSLTLDGDMKLNGPSGGTTSSVALGAGTLTVAGNLEFNNAAATTTSTNRINQITVSTGTISIGGNLVYNSNKATAAGCSVLQKIVFSGSGNLNIGGTIQFQSSAATPISVGTLTPSTGTVNFNGNSAVTIPLGVSAVTYNNLKINNTGGVTLGAAITATNVAGHLTIGDINTGSLLNTNNLAITLAASDTLGVHAGSTLDAGTSVITFGTTARAVINGTFKTANTAGFSGGSTTAINTVTNTPTLTLGSNSTIEYSSNSSQPITLRDYANLASSGSGARTLPSGTVGITGTFTPGTNTYTITGNTIDFKGTGAQTIPAFNYNNLTISTARTTNSITLAALGTIGVAGTFNPSATFTSGAFINTGSTIDFNGTGAQSVPAFNYNNLTVSGAKTTNSVTLANSGTIGVAGTFTPSATFTTGAYINTGSTVNFNGSGSQTISAFNYNNLTSSSTGARTLASSGTIGIAGAFTKGTNSYTTTGSTVDYNGTGAQTIVALRYDNLTISGSRSASPAITLASTDTIHVAGTFSVTATGVGSYTTTGSTVNYNGASQTLASLAYNNILLSGSGTVTSAALPNIGGNFTMSGSASYTNTTASWVIGGNLTVGASNTFAANNATAPLTVNGNTVISGSASSSQAGKTFNGDFTVNSGGSWTEGANPAYTFAGNVTNNGTISLGGGTINFTGASKTLSGSGAITAAAASISGTYTNNGTFTASTALSGSGTLTQGTGGVLNIGGTAGITNLNASTNVNTVNYTSSSNQTIRAINYSSLGISGGSSAAKALGGNITVSGTLTVAASTILAFRSTAQTLTLSGTAANTVSNNGTIAMDSANAAHVLQVASSSISSFGTINTGTGSTIEFNGGVSQTIPAFNYNNLLSSSSGSRTLTSSGTIGIAGIFTPGTNTYTVAGSTIDFNGSGSQNINAFNYHNLTSSSTGTRTLPSTGTVGIAGAFTPGNNTYTLTGSTVEYNGSSAQDVASFTYNNVSFSGAGAKTLPASMTVQGSWTNNGTIIASTGTVILAGSSSQSLSGSSVTTFNNLTINNSAGMVLSGSVNARVDGTLTFTAGKITTYNNSYNNYIILGASATVSGAAAGKYVDGNLRRYVPNTSSPSLGFDVGGSANYVPVTLSFSGTTSGSGYLDVRTVYQGAAPPAASGLSSTKYIARSWVISNSGVTGFSSVGATFNFVAGDIAGGANTSNLVVRRLESSIWYSTTPGTRQSTFTEATGIISFGEFYIGESGSAPTITTHPSSDSICAGSNKTFASAASSATSVQAQWQRSADGGSNWTEITSGLDASTTYSGFATSSLTLNGSSVDLSGYRYRVVYTNINGSTNSNAAILYVAGIPTTSAAGDDQTGIATCGLTAVTLAANAPTTGAGLWSVVSGSGGSFSSASSASSTFNGISGNSYTLRWTITSRPCAASTDDVVISLSALPTLTTTTAQSVCDVVSVELADGITSSTSGLAVDYYADPSLSSPLGSSVVSAGGMYYVKVTDAIGCTKSDNIYALMRTSPDLTTVDTIPGECGVSSLDLNEAITSDVTGLTTTYYTDRDLTASIGATVFSSGKYYIKVVNNVACYDYDSTKIEIRPRPATPDTVRGNRDACPIKKSAALPDGISAIYNFKKIEGAIGYEWQLPENITSVNRAYVGTENDTIVTLVYDTAYYFTDTITIRSLAANGCYSIPYYVKVDVNYVEWPYRGTIAGPANVCNFVNQDTTIMYTVYQREFATSVIWEPPVGATVVSGQGNDTCFIRFDSTFTGGDLRVAFSCNCNTSLYRPYTLRASAPMMPSLISGPVNVCGFTGSATAVTYSVNPAYDVLRFRWTLPPNVTIQSANSDSSVINVLFGASFALNTNKVIYVQGVSGCGISSARSLTLSTTKPLAPSVIYGPTNACNYVGIADTATYYFFPVSNAVGYIWSVPAGATIVDRPGAGGPGDTLIRVVFDNGFVNGSSISVRSRSTCDTSTTKTYVVYRQLPAIPAAIFGSTDACPNMISASSPSGTPMAYSIRKVSGAFNYNWTIPAGATKTHPNGSGANDTIIYVTFGTAFTSGNIGVASGNGCGYGSAKTLSVTRLLPVQPVAINGPTNACPLMESGANPGGDTAVYSISPTANSTSYVWTLPAGARFVAGTSTSGTSVSVIFGSSFVSGNIGVAAANNCAVSAARTLTVSRLLPVQPVSISGPTDACPLMEPTGTPAVYSTSATANATSYRWTLPAGVRFANSDTTGLSVSVIFSSTFTTGNIGVAAVNNCAVSAVRTLTVSRLLPVQPGTISGPTDACPLMRSTANPSGTPATYRISKSANATSYTWSVPSGASIDSRPGGQGTANDTVIVVIFSSSFTSGNISVIANNNCASSIARTLAVSRLLPVQPVAISGPTNACPLMESATNPGGDTAVYSIAATANATSYTWTLPTGARFVAGTSVTGTSISVIFGSTFSTGNISVAANNNCASSLARTLTVSRLLPVQPVSISGPVNACPLMESAANPGGDTAVYSIAATANSTSYSWTLPAGARFVANTSTTGTSVSVIFESGFTSGNISVAANNNCASSIARTLTVSRLLPAQPGAISGPTNACPWMESSTNIGGDTAVYSIATAANATSYTWTLPTGARFVANTNTTGTSVSVIFASSFTSGNIAVVANNNCASSIARTLTVSRLLPAQPGTISGPTNACPWMESSTNIGGDTAVYSIASAGNATSYTWTLPTGARFVANTNTTGTSVSVIFASSFTSGNIAVVANNNCASSIARTLTVSRILPAQPGTITATSLTTSCPRRFSYSVAAMPANATSLSWSVPSGATIDSTTNSGRTIWVKYAATGSNITGTVSVTAINNCSSSLPRTLSVTIQSCPPPPPTSIVGETPVKEVKNPADEIGSNGNDISVSVFPNPSTYKFFVQVKSSYSEPVNVRVLDQQGREMARYQKIMPGSVLQVGEQLRPGIYLIEIRQGKRTEIKKVIKQ